MKFEDVYKNIIKEDNDSSLITINHDYDAELVDWCSVILIFPNQFEEGNILKQFKEFLYQYYIKTEKLEKQDIKNCINETANFIIEQLKRFKNGGLKELQNGTKIPAEHYGSKLIESPLPKFVNYYNEELKKHKKANNQHKCPNCGTPITSKEQKFCEECGQKLK